MFRLETLAAFILVLVALVIGGPRQWDGMLIGLVLGVVLDRTILDSLARVRGRR